MKKIKCIKCGLSFKDRKDPNDNIGEDTLCWNCRFIWQSIKLTITALSSDNPFMMKPLNRTVHIRFEDVDIFKK